MPASIKLCKAEVIPPGDTAKQTVFFRSNVNMYKDAFGAAVGIVPATEAEASGQAAYNVRCFVKLTQT